MHARVLLVPFLWKTLINTSSIGGSFWENATSEKCMRHEQDLYARGNIWLKTVLPKYGEIQDGGGVGGRGVHLSPWMHKEYIYRCNNSHRTLAEN